MFELNAKIQKMKPKIVLLVPCMVLLAACSSKQIQNASMEPLDMPGEENSLAMTPEPMSDATSYGTDTRDGDASLAQPLTEGTIDSSPTKPSRVASHHSSKKHHKHSKALAQHARKHSRNKIAKRASRKTMIAREAVKPVSAAATTSSAEATTALPQIGDSNLNNAQAAIEMPQIAPPIPLDQAIENPQQPNWLLAAFIVAGIVALIALALRLRRYQRNKRGLVFN